MRKQKGSPDGMECPCLCDCGRWCEQDDMVANPMDEYYQPHGSYTLVCEPCRNRLERELKSELAKERRRTKAER